MIDNQPLAGSKPATGTNHPPAPRLDWNFETHQKARARAASVVLIRLESGALRA